MIPSVTQHLEAIRRRLIESVVPELPADAAFAQEQVLLIGAALEFLIECHEHEYRYAVTENHDYRILLEELTGSGAAAGEAAELLAEQGPAPDDGAIPLRTITEQTARMKVAAERLHSRLVAAQRFTAGEPDVSALFGRIAVRQVEREAAWFRRAGFTRDADPIEAVLKGARS
jgi:hypothetical protein